MDDRLAAGDPEQCWQCQEETESVEDRSEVETAHETRGPRVPAHICERGRDPHPWRGFVEVVVGSSDRGWDAAGGEGVRQAVRVVGDAPATALLHEQYAAAAQFVRGIFTVHACNRTTAHRRNVP